MHDAYDVHACVWGHTPRRPCGPCAHWVALPAPRPSAPPGSGCIAKMTAYSPFQHVSFEGAAPQFRLDFFGTMIMRNTRAEDHWRPGIRMKTRIVTARTRLKAQTCRDVPGALHGGVAKGIAWTRKQDGRPAVDEAREGGKRTCERKGAADIGG